MDPKREAARKAVSLIKNETTIGLGAGSTMAYMAEFIKEEMNAGLSVKLASSSFSTRHLLRAQHFPVIEAGSISHLDIYFDGCDQFDRDLNALKSGGGIHTSEKIMAAIAEKFILVGDESKYAEVLGTKFPLVVEVLPQALSFAMAKIQVLFPGVAVKLRMATNKDGAVVTDNGNYLLDMWFQQWPELGQINPEMKNLPGVVETSLFYHMAHKAVIAGSDGVRIIERHGTVS